MFTISALGSCLSTASWTKKCRALLRRNHSGENGIRPIVKGRRQLQNKLRDKQPTASLPLLLGTFSLHGSTLSPLWSFFKKEDMIIVTLV